LDAIPIIRRIVFHILRLQDINVPVLDSVVLAIQMKDTIVSRY